MTTFQAIVLGLIQGLGEFLPISSSGHLVIIPDLLGWQYQGLTFDVLLHGATLIAILIYFWKDWMKIIKDGLSEPKSQDGRMLWLLALATVPGGLAGLFLNDLAETTLRAPWLIATALIIFAVVLWLADRKASSAQTAALSVRTALIIGFAQALALVPGVSRSGITITAALFLGFSRSDAARISFLMATPIIGAATVLALRHLTLSEITLPLLCGFLAAGISGWAAIAFLMKYVRTRSYVIFAVYRIALGLLILGTVFFR